MNDSAVFQIAISSAEGASDVFCASAPAFSDADVFFFSAEAVAGFCVCRATPDCLSFEAAALGAGFGLLESGRLAFGVSCPELKQTAATHNPAHNSPIETRMGILLAISHCSYFARPMPRFAFSFA